MKNNKKNFNKFTKRNVHKRKGKEKSLQRIKAELGKSGVSFDGAKISVKTDGGRRARVSQTPQRDEIRARGLFSGSKSGFGFVTVEGEACDIFIPEDKTGGAIHGDLVEVVYHTYRRAGGEIKTEGRVVKIVEYGVTTLVGTLIHEPSHFRGRRRIPDKYYILPDDTRIGIRPTVSDTAGAVDGDKVAATVLRGYIPEAKITAVLGDTFSMKANYEAVLIESGIPTDFTPEELCEAERVAREPLSEQGRERFDGLTIMTIDGEGAKDLDDAVSVVKSGEGWRLYVHIADVASYVREKTPLDRAVMSRGTSVYFTDKVVPMLPPVLSNGVCSLNAGEDKYAVSAVITLDKNGEIIKTKILPSIINSRVRGVYSEVNKILENRADAATRVKYKPVLPLIKRMHELYTVLYKKAEKRGYLEMEVAESEILLDGEGNPVGIERRERGVAERMIEQFMLTANEAVARLLSEKEIPCVYRVHDEPPADKMEDFLLFVHNLGFDTSVISRDKVDTDTLSRLLGIAEQRGLLAPVSYTLLRSMAKAKYSEIRSPHFGLSLDYYCHFTSPIRRLSDLATHRIIHRVLLEGKRPDAYKSYAKRAAVAATDAELRALGAERRIESLYKTLYMSRFIGEEFDAVVCSITSFGMFAELENTCEGLIPISEMPGLFLYDEGNRTLRAGSVIYRLGDKIRVRLEEADMIRGKLRFSLLL
ncbi:MAG: VacB/RNase II family 3'-5' exoribonuclease [Clostridia bacterium]|nr:VacB/RNase II family 3'-5' exoribonuclease [Clostridia bacterium]